MEVWLRTDEREESVSSLREKGTDLFSSNRIQTLSPSATYTPMSNGAKAGDFERGVSERRCSAASPRAPALVSSAMHPARGGVSEQMVLGTFDETKVPRRRGAKTPDFNKAVPQAHPI